MQKKAEVTCSSVSTRLSIGRSLLPSRLVFAVLWVRIIGEDQNGAIGGFSP